MYKDGTGILATNGLLKLLIYSVCYRVVLTINAHDEHCY